jgi:type II secretory pathway pseudopilin PulG
MRFSLPNKNTRSKGFTLVEMLVIAPVVILVIGGIIALMVNLVGDVLVTRDRNAMTYDIQDALDRIEQDTRLSNLFLTTTGTLTTPQGSNNNFTGTSAFTNTSSLILSANTTDKNPTDSTRQLIYYANQPNACGSSETFNALLASKIIYFIKGTSLWRREVLPTWNTNATVDANTVCDPPWQRNTCSPGYSAALCQTDDSEVMQNISSLSVNYYTDASSTTPLAAASAGSASTIEVTINGSRSTAGDTITASGVMRVNKLN